MTVSRAATMTAQASKGNKALQVTPLVWALVFTPPIVFGYIYLMQVQAYALRIDVIAGSVGLTMCALEALFMVPTVIGIAAGGG